MPTIGQISLPDTPEWQARQDAARYELKRLTKLKVTQALEEIKVDEMMASPEATTGEKKNRRAVVLYMDRGKSGSSSSSPRSSI